MGFAALSRFAVLVVLFVSVYAQEYTNNMPAYPTSSSPSGGTATSPAPQGPSEQSSTASATETATAPWLTASHLQERAERQAYEAEIARVNAIIASQKPGIGVAVNPQSAEWPVAIKSLAPLLGSWRVRMIIFGNKAMTKEIGRVEGMLTINPNGELVMNPLTAFNPLQARSFRAGIGGHSATNYCGLFVK